MKIVLIVLVAIVLAAATGFGGYTVGHSAGLTEQQAIRAEFFQQRAGAQSTDPAGQNGAARNSQFGRGTIGTVKSVQGNVIQLTAQDGSVVTVTVDAQTQFQKTANATISDVQTGERITVLSDQTGSNITARTIQIRQGGQ
ncbi:MAG: hypothetical protein KGJ80_01780 [Chloroflexota bacterium]|nr:hypothetical protein [Chloroflexota bacterium]